MCDASFFTQPVLAWQKRYEALRASFVDLLPAKAVAKRFGYTTAYVHYLRHLFLSGKIDFTDPVPEGKTARRKVDAVLRCRIKVLRGRLLSAREIAKHLAEQNLEISVRTIERVLHEEGFSRLPRKAREKQELAIRIKAPGGISRSVTGKKRAAGEEK